MKNSNIIRAWKDQAYRNSLSDAERAALPENPAGTIVLSADQAARVRGGTKNPPNPVWIAPSTTLTAGCYGDTESGQ